MSRGGPSSSWLLPSIRQFNDGVAGLEPPEPISPEYVKEVDDEAYQLLLRMSSSLSASTSLPGALGPICSATARRGHKHNAARGAKAGAAHAHAVHMDQHVRHGTHLTPALRPAQPGEQHKQQQVQHVPAPVHAGAGKHPSAASPPPRPPSAASQHPHKPAALPCIPIGSTAHDSPELQAARHAWPMVPVEHGQGAAVHQHAAATAGEMDADMLDAALGGDEEKENAEEEPLGAGQPLAGATGAAGTGALAAAANAQPPSGSGRKRGRAGASGKRPPKNDTEYLRRQMSRLRAKAAKPGARAAGGQARKAAGAGAGAPVEQEAGEGRGRRQGQAQGRLQDGDKIQGGRMQEREEDSEEESESAQGSSDSEEAAGVVAGSASVPAGGDNGQGHEEGEQHGVAGGRAAPSRAIVLQQGTAPAPLTSSDSDEDSEEEEQEEGGRPVGGGLRTGHAPAQLSTAAATHAAAAPHAQPPRSLDRPQPGARSAVATFSQHKPVPGQRLSRTGNQPPTRKPSQLVQPVRSIYDMQVGVPASSGHFSRPQASQLLAAHDQSLRTQQERAMAAERERLGLTGPTQPSLPTPALAVHPTQPVSYKPKPPPPKTGLQAGGTLALQVITASLTGTGGAATTGVSGAGVEGAAHGVPSPVVQVLPVFGSPRTRHTLAVLAARTHDAGDKDGVEAMRLNWAKSLAGDLDMPPAAAVPKAMSVDRAAPPVAAPAALPAPLPSSPPAPATAQTTAQTISAAVRAPVPPQQQRAKCTSPEVEELAALLAAPEQTAPQHNSTRTSLTQLPAVHELLAQFQRAQAPLGGSQSPSKPATAQQAAAAGAAAAADPQMQQQPWDIDTLFEDSSQDNRAVPHPDHAPSQPAPAAPSVQAAGPSSLQHADTPAPGAAVAQLHVATPVAAPLCGTVTAGAVAAEGYTLMSDTQLEALAAALLRASSGAVSAAARPTPGSGTAAASEGMRDEGGGAVPQSRKRTAAAAVEGEGGDGDGSGERVEGEEWEEEGGGLEEEMEVDGEDGEGEGSGLMAEEWLEVGQEAEGPSHAAIGAGPQAMVAAGGGPAGRAQPKRSGGVSTKAKKQGTGSRQPAAHHKRILNLFEGGDQPPGGGVVSHTAAGQQMVMREVGLYADIKAHLKAANKRRRGGGGDVGAAPGHGTNGAAGQRGNVAGGERARQQPKSKRPTFEVIEQPPCRFWRMGACSRGADCKFSHSGEPVTALIPCRDYASAAGCPRAAACRFSHEAGLAAPCRALITRGACTTSSCQYAHGYDADQISLLQEYYEFCKRAMAAHAQQPRMHLDS